MPFLKSCWRFSKEDNLIEAERELTLISSTIKSHLKHDSSGYMTIPVYPSGEEMTQINSRLSLISYRLFPIDQTVPPRARYNRTDLPVAYRWDSIRCLLKSQIALQRFSPIEHLRRLRVTKTCNWLSRRWEGNVAIISFFLLGISQIVLFWTLHVISHQNIFS